MKRWYLGLAVAALFFLLVAVSAWSSDHADLPTSVWRASVDANYFRGGKAIVTANATPGTAYTTGATYTTGVHAISFYNSGSAAVYIRLDGLAASDAYTIPLPPSATFLSVTQYLVTSASIYAAAPQTVYVAW